MANKADRIAYSSYAVAPQDCIEKSIGIKRVRFHDFSGAEWVDTFRPGAQKWNMFDRIGLFGEDLVPNQSCVVAFDGAPAGVPV